MIWLWIYLGGAAVMLVLAVAWTSSSTDDGSMPEDAGDTIWPATFLWPLTVLLVIGLWIGERWRTRR